MSKIRGNTNYWKAIIACAVALAFIMPASSVFAYTKEKQAPLQDFTMEVVDITGAIGGSVTVQVTGSWNIIIQAYQFYVGFDTSKLAFDHVDFTGTIANTYTADYKLGNEMIPGVLSVGAVWFPGSGGDPYANMPPAGSGVLAKLVFDIIATEETTTDLVFTTYQGAPSVYTGTDGQNRYAETTDGTVTITEVHYVCGDANGDGKVNVSDAVWIINYVFVGGAAPDPLCVGDANADGKVNVSDAVWIINYVFVGGLPPQHSAGCPCSPP
jgi:hypothetical protein